MTKSLGGSIDPLVTNLIELFKEKTRLDLQKDVLAHIGPKMAFYLSQAKEKEEEDESQTAAPEPEAPDTGGRLGGWPAAST